MDPLQWMGAVRMRVQTADKKHPQVIHTTPIQSTPESSIHNITLSSKRVIWSESREKYAQIKHRLPVKKSKGVDMLVYCDERPQQGMGFFNGGSVFMNYGLYFGQNW